MVVDEIRVAEHAAICVAISELVRLLVKSGTLREGDVVEHFRKMSIDLMDKKGGMHGVQLADMICDAARGNPNGNPPS